MLALLRRALGDERGIADAPPVEDAALEFLAARAGRRRPHRARRARPGLRDRGRRQGHPAPRRGRPPAQGRALRQGRRPPLRHDLGLDQGHPRLRPRRLAALPGRDDRGRRGRALHRPPDGGAGERGHRQRRPAGARGGRGGGPRRGARGHAGVPAEPGPGGRVPGAGAQVERLLQGPAGRPGLDPRARRPRDPGPPARRPLPRGQEARPRQGLRLPARPARRASQSSG